MIQQLVYMAGNCSAPLACRLDVIGNTYEGRPIHQLIASALYIIEIPVLCKHRFSSQSIFPKFQIQAYILDESSLERIDNLLFDEVPWCMLACAGDDSGGRQRAHGLLDRLADPRARVARRHVRHEHHQPRECMCT